MSNRNDLPPTEFWGDTAVRRRRPPKKRLRLGRLLLIICLSLAIFAGFSYAGFRLAGQWLGIMPGSQGAEGVALAESPDKMIPILLVGVDQRKDEPARSDTLMVAFIDPKGGRANILSIPRDTYVTIDKYGHDKINSAHAYGGNDLLLKTVNQFLGLNIKKYVEVNFDGFARIIDILGGVDINVDKRMYYPEEGINLKAGQQHLNGHDALGFVRFRFDPDGDITRIGRQQKFLKALVDQTLSLRTVPKLPRLIGEVSRHVNTNLTSKEILSLAMTMKDIKSDAIEARTVPGAPLDLKSGSYWQADQEKLSTILKQFSARKTEGR